MITSSDNSKLSLVRKLQGRKWRERENAFVTEGEDLLAAGLANGWEPREVLVAAGSGLDVTGVEVEPELLDGVSTLGSGTRVIAVWTLPEAAAEGSAVYLHGVSDPGNVGTIIRTAASLVGSRVVLGPGSADPYSPKATRATMGALFASPPAKGAIESTPSPRIGLVAHGGDDLDTAIAKVAAQGGTPTLCLGSERDGLPEDLVAACDATATIPLVAGAESLNVAAAAAIGLQRISSIAVGGGNG